MFHVFNRFAMVFDGFYGILRVFYGVHPIPIPTPTGLV